MARTTYCPAETWKVLRKMRFTVFEAALGSKRTNLRFIAQEKAKTLWNTSLTAGTGQ